MGSAKGVPGPTPETPVQYKKLTDEQKKIRNWRTRRNHLVQTLLDADPLLLRREALKRANRLMRRR